MSKNENEKKLSRRKFLEAGIMLGAGAITTGGAIMAGSNAEPEKTGKKIRLLTQDGKIVEVEESIVLDAEQNLTEKEIREGIPGRKFVMVVDLAKCKNVRKCISKCQEKHNLKPDQEFMKVLLMQDDKNMAPYWFPKPCYHCDQPACVKVCPVDATYKRHDGIVLIDNERCIGCKFCVAGCPYSARIFHWKEVEVSDEISKREYNPETSIPAKIGTVSKCDFCPDQSRLGLLPHCVTGCPMGVIYFGDVNEDTVTNGDETIKFSDIIRDRAGYRYLADLGTAPLVYYLPPVNRQFPFESGLDNLSEEVIERYKNTDYIKLKGE
jgi:molybdopterin-containing oxidoreductase family iron-sulfur binding subunit